MTKTKILTTLSVAGLGLLFAACGSSQQEKSQVSSTANQTYVQDLTAVLRGSCPAGYSVFAWDGTTKINYCVLYGSGVPSYGVKNLGGWMPTNWAEGSYTTGMVETPCSNLSVGEGRNRIRGAEFAYDGDARLSFCMLKTTIDIGQSYVTKVSANMGQSCPADWQQFTWNGRSNISYCYQTAVRQN